MSLSANRTVLINSSNKILLKPSEIIANETKVKQKTLIEYLVYKELIKFIPLSTTEEFFPKAIILDSYNKNTYQKNYSSVSTNWISTQITKFFCF